MRQNGWIALIIVFVVVSFTLFSAALSSNVSFTQIDAPSGTDPEATVGDTLVFIAGTNMTITGNASADTLTFTAATTGSAAAYDTVQDEGGSLTQRQILNFIGAGVTCVDDAVDSTDCTIPGGGATNSFETMNAPAGTDPVAASATDTLNFTVTGTDLTITGNSGTDTLDFDIVTNAGTDITADLEEETHATEHAIGAADEVAFYGLVDDEGTPLTARRTLNFVGAGVTCVDDGGGAETDCTIPGGGSGVTVEEDDSSVAATASTIDFGAGFDVTESPANEANITLDILEENLTNDSVWVGSAGGLAAESGVPDCTDTGGNHLNYTQSSNAFSCGTTESETQLLFFNINAPSGTDPQADTTTDTLNFTVTGADLTITGDSSTDTLDFDVVTNAGTDITADLEEETHASEHAIGAGDEVAFYGLVDDEGTPLTARRTLNFIGAGVTCVDDGPGAETDCTITSVGDITDVGPGCATGACLTDGVVTSGTDIFIWEGTTSDANELTISGPADPSIDQSFTFPDDQIEDDDAIVGTGAGTFDYVGFGPCNTMQAVTYNTGSNVFGCITVEPDTNTNASTECAGTQTYLDGEGNCDTLDDLADFETPTDDVVAVGNGSSFDTIALPDCSSINSATTYVTGSNTFGCNELFTERHAAFTQTGTLSLIVEVENLRLYSDQDGLTIQDVRCSVNTAPTGATIIVDVNMDGTTIFTTQANRPTIAIGANTDVSGTVDGDSSWDDGQFLQIEIDQVGSSVAGADLTCQVRVRETVYNTG